MAPKYLELISRVQNISRDNLGSLHLCWLVHIESPLNTLPFALRSWTEPPRIFNHHMWHGSETQLLLYCVFASVCIHTHFFFILKYNQSVSVDYQLHFSAGDAGFSVIVFKTTNIAQLQIVIFNVQYSELMRCLLCNVSGVNCLQSTALWPSGC